MFGQLLHVLDPRLRCLYRHGGDLQNGSKTIYEHRDAKMVASMDFIEIQVCH